MKKFLHFFDRLEDRVRERLSRYPILYAVIGGSAIILFWRGIWHLVDEFEKNYSLSNFEGAFLSLIIGALILLITGLFSSFFVGDAILISGLRREKKMIEKTEDEIDHEAGMLKRLQSDVSREESLLSEIKNEISALRATVEKMQQEKK